MNIKSLNKKCGLITGSTCVVIFAWQYFVHYHAITWLFAIGVLLVSVAVISPQSLQPLRLLWDRAGNVLGTINTAAILFLLYFLIITPVAFIMRLLGKSGLDLKFNTGVDTYWKPVNKTAQSSMKQQF